MASTSLKYISKKRIEDKKARKKAAVDEAAFAHSTTIDLNPLLIAAGPDIERIPLFYFHEGNA